MLWKTLEANGGTLPPGCLAVFCNTGKEEEATLRFVRDMALHWHIPIIWLEYRADEKGFAVVSFETASRNGEPFEAMVKKERYLPNARQRTCTSRLKIRVMHKYFRSLGWFDGDDGWDQFIGIRADEPRRVAKIRERGRSTETVKESMCMPLADAGIAVGDVRDFWAAQKFTLELFTDSKGRTKGGNCDLCFLKPAAQILSMIREKPERAIWWAKLEAHAQAEFVEKRSSDGWRFRNDRPSYQQMMDYADQQADLFDTDEEAIDCFCGD